MLVCTNRVRAVLAKQRADERAVVDVALHENMPRVAFQASQVVRVAGVGQLVQVDDGRALRLQPVVDEVGADEACAAGHQYHAWTPPRACGNMALSG
jgi:hypothetical protein